MRPENSVELKKTLPQKRKAWAVATASKKVKFVEVGLREALAE